MSENKEPMMKPALNSGLILGMTLIIFSIIFWLLGISTEKWTGIISFVVLAGMLVWLQLQYRKAQGGFVSYGRILGFGILTLLMSGIIVTVYTYIFLQYIDSGMIDTALEKAYESMREQELSKEEIKKAMSITSKMMTPGWMAFWGLFGNVFQGTIVALITSIFTSKKDPNAID